MVTVELQKEENRKAFLELYPGLAEEVLAELRKYNMPKDAYEWTKEVSIFEENNGWGMRYGSMVFSLYFFFIEPILQCTWR